MKRAVYAANLPHPQVGSNARVLLSEPGRVLACGSPALPVDAVDLALTALGARLSLDATQQYRRRFMTGEAGKFAIETAHGDVDILVASSNDGSLVVECAYSDRSERRDTLTGLMGRAALCSVLDTWLTETANVSVVFVDLDRFKQVNETLGHRAGDLLLRHVAARLQRVARQEDVVARIGGDEFAMGVRDIPNPQVETVARRMAARLAEPMKVGEELLHITASVGIATGNAASHDSESLLRDADSAMGKAKGGTGNVVRFEPRIRQQLLKSVSLERDLRTALEHGEIELHYQPTVSLATGRVLSVEGLARWNSPTRGMVPPGVFIPVAEDTGLILALGERVFRLAVAQAARWRDLTVLNDARVWVNVSPYQLRAGGFAERACAILKEFNLPVSAIGCEITESALTEDLEYEVGELGATGMALALDDFGTGYSSLASLRRHSFQLLKIDRTFVQGLSDDNDDHAIVRAIVEMGHALGSDVTAEGVEHGQQILELKALGCDSASGYLMAHPEPGDIIESVLQGGLPLISSAILNATPVRASGMGGEMGALQVSTSYEHSGAAADKSAAEVLLNLLHTSGSAGQRVSAFLTRFNLTMDELNVLMVLDEATEPLSPATVAERVIAATHRPHAVIDRLIRHALVECNGDQKVRPTTAGIALMTNLKPKLQEVEAGLFALVSEAQRSEWLRHTGALLQSINASTAPSSEPTAHGV